MEDTFRVFVIDDDPLVLRGLARVLRGNGFVVEAFASAAEFLARPLHDGPACVLLDLRMPGIDGLDVQDALTTRGVSFPIVFFSGHGDVPSAARAMRQGAVDFLVKPLDEAPLLDAVARARMRGTIAHERQQSERAALERLARLTPRERQVCEMVALGLLNKQIAYELGTVEKTIKVHRARVMRKLGVDSVAALVRLLAKLPREPDH